MITSSSARNENAQEYDDYQELREKNDNEQDPVQENNDQVRIKSDETRHELIEIFF